MHRSSIYTSSFLLELKQVNSHTLWLNQKYSTFPPGLSCKSPKIKKCLNSLCQAPDASACPSSFFSLFFFCLCIFLSVPCLDSQWRESGNPPLYLLFQSEAWQGPVLAFNAEADRPTQSSLASPLILLLLPPLLSSALPAQGSPQAAWLLRSSLLSHSLRESTERTEAGAHWAERWGCVPGSVSGQRVKKHTPGTCSIADRSK